MFLSLSRRTWFAWGMPALLAACGGSSSIEATAPAIAPLATLSVSGNVSGLTAGLVLQNNAADDLVLLANGHFSFAAMLNVGAAYHITVRSNPPFQLCTVSNGQGTASSDVTNITVACVDGVQVSTFAGSSLGSLDGTGTGARFHQPRAGVFDSDGNLLVSDTNNNSLRKITPAGGVSTLATGLDGPFGVTINQGRLLVVSEYGDKLLQVSAADGTVTEVVLSIPLTGPRGLAGDAAGNLYVSESTQLIRKITPAGVVSTLAGSGLQGRVDGLGTAASFYNPAGLAIDAAGNVYVADQSGPLVRKISPAGEVTTVAGRPGMVGGVDGPLGTATLTEPVGIALGSDGMLYVADNGGQKIRRVKPDGTIDSIAGLLFTTGTADGPGVNARFSYPAGAVFDAQGDLFVFDSDSHRIRKLTRN